MKLSRFIIIIIIEKRIKIDKKTEIAEAESATFLNKPSA